MGPRDPLAQSGSHKSKVESCEAVCLEGNLGKEDRSGDCWLSNGVQTVGEGAKGMDETPEKVSILLWVGANWGQKTSSRKGRKGKRGEGAKEESRIKTYVVRAVKDFLKGKA